MLQLRRRRRRRGRVHIARRPCRNHLPRALPVTKDAPLLELATVEEWRSRSRGPNTCRCIVLISVKHTGVIRIATHCDRRLKWGKLRVATPRPAADRENLAGLVEGVTFYNEDIGFRVLRVKARGQRELITVVGHVAVIGAGEFVQASGRWANDRTLGSAV